MGACLTESAYSLLRPPVTVLFPYGPVSEKRTAAINQYFIKSLQDLNVDTVRQDIPTSSTVTDVKIWEVEVAGMGESIGISEVSRPKDKSNTDFTV